MDLKKEKDKFMSFERPKWPIYKLKDYIIKCCLIFDKTKINVPKWKVNKRLKNPVIYMCKILKSDRLFYVFERFPAWVNLEGRYLWSVASTCEDVNIDTERR